MFSHVRYYSLLKMCSVDKICGLIEKVRVHKREQVPAGMPSPCYLTHLNHSFALAHEVCSTVEDNRGEHHPYTDTPHSHPIDMCIPSHAEFSPALANRCRCCKCLHKGGQGVGGYLCSVLWHVQKDKGNIVCVVTGNRSNTCVHWKVQIWGLCRYWYPQLQP